MTTEIVFRDKVRNLIKIHSDIAKLNTESKRLRLAIGKIATQKLNRTPTHDKPLTIALSDHGNSVTLVTVFTPKNNKQNDFTVLTKTIKVIQ